MGNILIAIEHLQLFTRDLESCLLRFFEVNAPDSMLRLFVSSVKYSKARSPHKKDKSLRKINLLLRYVYQM